MRKPRDYDLELQALTARAKTLKDRKVRQLGELVIATGADAIGMEMLAGVLIAAMESKDPSAKEAWRRGKWVLSPSGDRTWPSCRRR